MTTKTMAIADLRPADGNPKLHDLKTIKGSLAAYGQLGPIIVNEGSQTGRSMEILGGNGTWRAAAELGWEQIEVKLIDVGDVTAKKILAILNRSQDLGGYDEAALADLLKEIVNLDDLADTGYSEKDLLKLLKEPDPPISDAVMGDLEYRVIVDCTDETDQLKLLETLEAEGRTARPLIS